MYILLILVLIKGKHCVLSFVHFIQNYLKKNDNPVVYFI